LTKYDFLDDSDMENIAGIALNQDGANLVDVADKYVARLKKYNESQTESKYKKLENNQKTPNDVGGGGLTPTKKLKLGDGSAKNAFLATFRKSVEADS